MVSTLKLLASMAELAVFPWYWPRKITGTAPTVAPPRNFRHRLRTVLRFKRQNAILLSGQCDQYNVAMVSQLEIRIVLTGSVRRDGKKSHITAANHFAFSCHPLVYLLVQRVRR
jgi:hypothetical protein